MSGLAVLEIEGEELVPVVDDRGRPVFPASQACRALGFTNPHKALSDHVDPDDLTKREVIDSMGRKQVANFITGVGLQMLTFRSDLPKAREYTRKVAAYMEGLRTGEAVPARSRDDAMLINARTRMHREMMRSIDEIHACTPLAPEAVSAAKASIIEATFGKALPGLKPATSIDWFTPTMIAERLGCTAARVGLTVSALGIRGNHPGVSRAVLDKAAHSDKTVTSYQYTERAVAMIAAKIAELPADTSN